MARKSDTALSWTRENHSWFANAVLLLNGLGLVPSLAILILFLKYHHDMEKLLLLAVIPLLLFFMQMPFMVELMRLGRSFDRRWGDAEHLGVSSSILRLADGLIMIGSCTCGYWTCAISAYTAPVSDSDSDQFLLAAFGLIGGGAVASINDWLGRLVYAR